MATHARMANECVLATAIQSIRMSDKAREKHIRCTRRTQVMCVEWNGTDENTRSTSESRQFRNFAQRGGRDACVSIFVCVLYAYVQMHTYPLHTTMLYIRQYVGSRTTRTTRHTDTHGGGGGNQCCGCARIRFPISRLCASSIGLRDLFEFFWRFVRSKLRGVWKLMRDQRRLMRRRRCLRFVA